MKPGLVKEIVRERTAYKGGRSIVEGILIGQLALAVIAVVGVLVYESRRETAEVYTVAAVLCGAFLFSVQAVLQRELLHAVFDIADRALAGGRDPLSAENPFAPPPESVRGKAVE